MLRHLVSIAVCLACALACGSGGTVARYALCAASDTCPSATVCESPGGGNTTPSMCTWSCGDNDDSDNSCPSDATGVPGACVSLDGGGNYGYCFQTCGSGSPCPTGETCAKANTFDFDEATMVCVPSAAL